MQEGLPENQCDAQSTASTEEATRGTDIPEDIETDYSGGKFEADSRRGT